MRMQKCLMQVLEPKKCQALRWNGFGYPQWILRVRMIRWRFEFKACTNPVKVLGRAQSSREGSYARHFSCQCSTTTKNAVNIRKEDRIFKSALDTVMQDFEECTWNSKYWTGGPSWNQGGKQEFRNPVHFNRSPQLTFIFFWSAWARAGAVEESKDIVLSVLAIACRLRRLEFHPSSYFAVQVWIFWILFAHCVEFHRQFNIPKRL